MIVLFGPLHFHCPLFPDHLLPPFWLGPWFLSSVSYVGHRGIDMCAGCPHTDADRASAGPNKTGDCQVLAAV